MVVCWSSQVQDVCWEPSHPDCGEYPFQRVETWAVCIIRQTVNREDFSLQNYWNITSGGTVQLGWLKALHISPNHLLPAFLTILKKIEKFVSWILVNQTKRSMCATTWGTPAWSVSWLESSALPTTAPQDAHGCQGHSLQLNWARQNNTSGSKPSLSTSLLNCVLLRKEIGFLKAVACQPRIQWLISWDSCGFGGHVHNSDFVYSRHHSLISHGQRPLKRLIIRAGHICLFHAGPTLVFSSLSRCFHIIGQCKTIRTTTWSCVSCRRVMSKPQFLLIGQLPTERVTPGIVFDRKAYIGIFVSLSVKAVHLELVSDLTAGAFVACIWQFIDRRGKPGTIWSDHGTNFVGAACELTELAAFLEAQNESGEISGFCTSQGMEWSYIPERAPHFVAYGSP